MITLLISQFQVSAAVIIIRHISISNITISLIYLEQLINIKIMVTYLK